MRQLMHGDRRARGPVVVEIVSVNFVVAAEIIHVDQIRRDFDDIVQVCPGARRMSRMFSMTALVCAWMSR